MDIKRSSTPPVDDPATDPLVLGVPAVRTVIVIRAVLAVAFGLVALLWPDLTLVALAFAFGAYAILEGVASAVDAIRSRGRARWWWGLVRGLAGLVAGVLAFVWPGITALALAILVGAWAVVAGVTETAVAFRLRKAGRRSWLLGLAGVLSVVAGVVIVLWPVAGAIGLAVVLGVFALLYGAALAALAVSLRPSVPHRP
ncbi:HdeD family acid-resistance protein [Pseudonocardia sp. KRD-182]|uniref:HdeD family acid-resistance protein n=1 Tax=Pseudonocardia oceani TaxID=2792013 RepID=UPI001C5C2F04|nr:HdeD family acid-resistance protein [Pseudonocardia oceani]MBW0108599.1 HdeD family acid-resistance protein [Pseudonocardia oceani]